MSRRTLVTVALLFLPTPQLVPTTNPIVGLRRTVVAHVVQGEPSTDPRWSAWLGCWTPAARGRGGADVQLCIVPAQDGRGVRRVTFAGDREVLSEVIVADGTPQALDERDCTGTRESRWSQSGSRLLSSSTMRCANQPALTTTGISALLGEDQWLDVQVSNAGPRGEQIRTQRFWRSSGAPPAPVAGLVGNLTLTRTPILSVSIDDVIEASGLVGAGAVEAWLAESGARIPVNRRSLVRLSDAHVAGSVIDLMVAMAYPRKFEVKRASSGGGSPFGGGFADDFYPGGWGYLADYGFGYGAFGVPYYYLGLNGYYPPGIFFVPGGSSEFEPTTHGHVVNGQGYTRIEPRDAYRGTASSGSGSRTSSTSGDSGSAGSSGGGSSSGGASPAGYSGGGGSSTGQTAVPR